MPESDTRNTREPVLAQLKHPLVFFGLSVLATEVSLGGALVARENTDLVMIVFAILMAMIIITAILVVGFLVKTSPEGLMLKPQGHVQISEAVMRARIQTMTAQERVRVFGSIEPSEGPQLE